MKILTKSLFLFLVFLQNFNLMAEAKMSSKEFFSKLSSTQMDLVNEFYDDKIVFKDPLGEHLGVDQVRNYYTGLYKSVESIRFDFDRQIQSGNDEVLFWTMHLKTPNLNGGKEFAVSGNSHFSYSAQSQKCIYHRDYFDMGEFIYERLPVLKSVIHVIKNRLKNK